MYGIFNSKEEHDQWMAEAKASREKLEGFIEEVNRRLDDESTTAEAIVDQVQSIISELQSLTKLTTNTIGLILSMYRKISEKVIP